MLRKIMFGFFALSFVIAVVFIPLQVARAHGSMQDPVSRIYACYLENPETPDTLACRDAIEMGGTQPLYDWNEVNQRNAGGNHQTVIPDGMLCSGGREKYAPFDDPRADWAMTFMPDSGPYTLIYEAYVPHNQGYFEIYVTNDEYDFSEPLKWSDLEFPPFAIIEEPPVINGDYYLDVEIPPGKRGRHVIYAIWQRTDSQEAFYSCSDVWFGNSPTPVATAPPACKYPAWVNSIIYNVNDMVTYNSISWRAKWGNSATVPSTAGNTNPWEFNGECTIGGETPPPGGPTPTPESGTRGDVDEDGDVDIIDALATAQHYVGLIPARFNPDFADVDCDNEIDIVDALLIAQYYVGLLTEFCQA